VGSPNDFTVSLPKAKVMFDVLFHYFEDKSAIELTPEHKQHIEAVFKPKKLRKRRYLFEEGDICKFAAFIVKGSARMFTIDSKGHEHIVRFGVEGWWLGDSESYLLELPTRYNVEMLEDSEVLLVNKDDYQHLVDTIPAIAAATKSLDKQSFVSNQTRIHASISMTAEERFDDLVKRYPAFLQRFPQNMIASYLGISPETLSRIRSRHAGH
jgi:CRP-like cAMP-binding protein